MSRQIIQGQTLTLILPEFTSKVNPSRRAASVTLDPKRAGEPPVPQRDGVASLRYALNAPDCLAARGAAVIAKFT